MQSRYVRASWESGIRRSIGKKNCDKVTEYYSSKVSNYFSNYSTQSLCHNFFFESQELEYSEPESSSAVWVSRRKVTVLLSTIVPRTVTFFSFLSSFFFSSPRRISGARTQGGRTMGALSITWRDCWFVVFLLFFVFICPQT